MKDFTVMIMGDGTSPVRRFYVPEQKLRRLVTLAAIVGVVAVLGFWDYLRLNGGRSELALLRVEAVEQREQIHVFEKTLTTVQGTLERVRHLERKIRLIANLPGAAATGGTEVTEIAPASMGGVFPAAQGQLHVPTDPFGAPMELGPHFESPRGPSQSLEEDPAPRAGYTTRGARQLSLMNRRAQGLGGAAERISGSLEELVTQLEAKRGKLASMPSIWPARGWLTSRFGYRVSPFTGRSQRHGGVDIAARRGTPVIAPARGRIKYVGSRGALGKTLVIDHGFGVQTLYGHNDTIKVRIGEQVERGQQIASIGSTGRSTGPHLHYVVEVRGKAQNPLDYIFD